MESTSQFEQGGGTRVRLPSHVEGPFDVFVNGVPQQPGVDFDRVGRSLVFRGPLAQEGKLGFWRWLSLFSGVAGTYRRNDTVDVVYTRDGRRAVESLRLQPPESSDSSA